MEICLLSAPFERVFGVFSGLFLLSILYAILLQVAEERWGFVSDYTWLTVVIGVGYTVAAVAILDAGAALLALLAFAVSSIPIIIRSLILDVRQRAELRRYLAERGNGKARDPGDGA